LVSWARALTDADGERHAPAQESLVGELLALEQLAHAVEALEPFGELSIVRPRPSRPGEHLVIERAEVVVREEVGHGAGGE